MPSRPVLIGRGLVPHTVHHHTHTHRLRDARVHYAVPNQHNHTGSRPLSRSQPSLETPPHTWVRVCRSDRVTAAIAKRETPGPIPNPEVKPFSADGTATERLWESRTPPDKHQQRPPSDVVACVSARVSAAIAKGRTPGPIPNPEVKPFSADGTATARLWESRTPPDIHCVEATATVASTPFRTGSWRGAVVAEDRRQQASRSR